MNILEKKEKSNFSQKYTFSDSKSEAIEKEILIFLAFLSKFVMKNQFMKIFGTSKMQKAAKTDKNYKKKQ